MRSLLVSVLALILGFALGAPAAHAAAPRSAELWHVAAITDPGNGKFTYCAVESTFDNGFSLAFARNRDLDTNVVVTFPRPALEDHTKFHMQLVIDANSPRDFIGFSANSTTLVIPLQHDRATLELLQKGKLLEIKGPKDAIKFALDGADDAVRQLHACVEKGLKTETATANGTPEPRPQVQQSPIAVDTIPTGTTMVEPLPLPGHEASTAATSDPAAQPQAPAYSPPAQKPVETVMGAPTVNSLFKPAPNGTLTIKNGPVAPPAAAPPTSTQPAPVAPTGSDEAKIEQEDDAAARAAAARLTAIREKAAADETAKADSAKADADTKAAQQQQGAKEEAEQQAKQDEAQKAQAARIAKAQADQDAAEQVSDDAAAKAALVKLQAQQAAAKPAAPVAPPPAAPAPKPTTPQIERPPVTAEPLALQSAPKAVGNLNDLLRQAGLEPTAVTGEAGTYSFKNGAIAGEAMETRAQKPFLDTLLDNIDSLEKGCKGKFSASLGAPTQHGDLTYSEVATNCSGIAGVVLYYEKSGRYGMIAQESTDSDHETAALTRKRLETELANSTNYK